MSTRSCIIAKTQDGYAGIYCHHDGYPEGVGQTLLNHYSDPEKVAQLIALGDISVLGDNLTPTGKHSFREPEDGVTIAYGRDRGEVGTKAFSASTLDEVEAHFARAHNGYAYVYNGAAWFLNGTPLPQAIRNAAISDEIAAAND